MKKTQMVIVSLCMMLFLLPVFAGCGSDEVISVSDLGKSSETTVSEKEASDSEQGTAEGESSGAGMGTGELTDTSELIGTWNESACTYTNTELELELALTEEWTADLSNESGAIFEYEKNGLAATAEFVFDIGGAYEDTDAAWDAYYEYAGLDEDTLLLLAASAYVSYGTDVIGGKDFETLNVIYQADGNETYQYVAIGKAEGCVAVLMLSIDAELAAFDSEEAAQNAMQEIVETVQVW